VLISFYNVQDKKGASDCYYIIYREVSCNKRIYICAVTGISTRFPDNNSEGRNYIYEML